MSLIPNNAYGGGGGSVDLASPGPIGGTTPAAGSFTGLDLGSSGQVNLSGPSAAVLQMGTDHATTPTAQRLKAHNVTTGTGANLELAGGDGSAANGGVKVMTHLEFDSDGSISSPALRIGGGTTGFYSSSSNFINVACAGVERARFSATDNYSFATAGFHFNGKLYFGSGSDTCLTKPASGIVQLSATNGSTGATLEFLEQTAPSASTNAARIYAEDNGSGKTRLMVIFGSGAAQQIAIEP